MDSMAKDERPESGPIAGKNRDRSIPPDGYSVGGRGR